MSDLSVHATHFGRMIKENWYWVSGGAGALWYAAIRIKRLIFSDYATNQYVNTAMKQCRDDICGKIEEMDKRNTEQHTEIYTQIIEILKGHNP